MSWSGSCEWHAKGYMVLPCSAELEIEFQVEDANKLREHLEKSNKQIKRRSRESRSKKSLLTEDDVYEMLKDEFSDILDRDLYDYCNADDYYEPFMEEFPSEGVYEFEKKCKEWGIEIVDISGGGEVEY